MSVVRTLTVACFFGSQVGGSLILEVPVYVVYLFVKVGNDDCDK